MLKARLKNGPLFLVVLLFLYSCNAPTEAVTEADTAPPNDYAVALISSEAKSQSELSRDESDFFAFVRSALKVTNPADLYFVPGSMRIETTKFNDLEEYKFYLAGLVQDLPESRLKYYRLELLEINGKLSLLDRADNLIVVKTCYKTASGLDCGYEDAYRKDGNVKYLCACSPEEQTNEEYYLGERKTLPIE